MKYAKCKKKPGGGKPWNKDQASNCFFRRQLSPYDLVGSGSVDSNQNNIPNSTMERITISQKSSTAGLMMANNRAAEVLRTPIAKVVRALSARLLFAMHGLVAIWRVSTIYVDEIYWFLALFLIILFIEGGLIIHQRQGKETTWFCPSVFLFLCAVVPAIWFLQLHVCKLRIQESELSRKENMTRCEIESSVGEQADFEFGDIKIGLVIPMIKEDMWVQFLQQTMMLVLILGRWVLPRGDISRDHLSQILLVFLGMAADMVELFDTFKEQQVAPNMTLTTLVLGVWSWSLIQFPLVLTGVQSKKSRLGYLTRRLERSSFKASQKGGQFLAPGVAGDRDHMDMNFEALRPLVKRSLSYKLFFHTLIADINFWGVVSGIFLQDAPFLAIRLYLLIKHKTISYMMIFFTVKNLMVVLLQTYRFYVICLESYAKVKEAKENFFMTTLSRTPSPRASLSDRRKAAAANRSISSNALLVSTSKISRENEKKKKERKQNNKKSSAVKTFQKRQDYVDSKGKSQSMGPLLEQDLSADETMIFENKKAEIGSHSSEKGDKKQQKSKSISPNEEKVIGRLGVGDHDHKEEEAMDGKIQTESYVTNEEKQDAGNIDSKVGNNENIVETKKLIVFDDEDINMITD